MSAQSLDSEQVSNKSQDSATKDVWTPSFSSFGAMQFGTTRLNAPDFGHDFYAPLVKGSQLGAYEEEPESKGFVFKSPSG